MTSRTAAVRYARALFDVALKEQQDLDAIEAQLAAFVDLVKANPTLEQVLLNPAIPAPRKRAALAALVARATPPPALGKLLVLLAERDRLVILADLLAAYRDRLLDHRRVVRAEVITAAPLPPDRAQAIERGLAQLSGRSVQMEQRVDPALIGGLIARVGSIVYDASIATQLQKMKQKLVEKT